MRHHSIIARLGAADTIAVPPMRVDSLPTEISFVDGNHRPGYGLGQALDQLQELGLRPSETAIELALLGAAVTAADTRISRAQDAQDAWTREIAINLPVQNVSRWQGLSGLLTQTLNFLTGDRWSFHFRSRRQVRQISRSRPLSCGLRRQPRSASSPAGSIASSAP